MKALVLFVFIFLPYCLWAQTIITGTVLEADKNTPVSGATVFLANTSVGTTANAEGRFTLTIPQGKYELIVSSIGYETHNQVIESSSGNTTLIIKLKTKVQELENVVVAPFEPDGWAKWGSFFMENFIGTTANAHDCILKNKDVLKFRHDKKKNELTVIAFEPLVIQNKALGYNLQYQLESFSYNFKTNYLLYQGYPFFQPMPGGTGKQKRWAARRQETYEGSLMHFMRSLYINRIAEAGFEVRTLVKQPNTEKERVKPLYNQAIRSKGNTITLTNSKDDSLGYYERIMQQPDIFDIIHKHVLTGDSIAYAIDDFTAGLSFPHYLWIKYKNKTVPQEYRKLYPKNGTAMVSQLTLLAEGVQVQSSGNYYNPVDLLSMGYWGWSEKMSTLLPYDFKAKQ